MIIINLCWQYFRAWMPMMLEEQYGYTKEQTQYFSSAYYLVAGSRLHRGGVPGQVAGRRGAGRSIGRGWRRSLVCVAAHRPGHGRVDRCRPRGSCWPLLLAIGFGSLGQFPTYYAFTQELSVRQMGKITGVLSFLTWTSTALAQSRSAAGSIGQAPTPRSPSWPA